MVVVGTKILSYDGRIFVSYAPSVGEYEVNLWKGTQYQYTIRVTKSKMADYASLVDHSLYDYLVREGDGCTFLELEDLISRVAK